MQEHGARTCLLGVAGGGDTGVFQEAQRHPGQDLSCRAEGGSSLGMRETWRRGSSTPQQPQGPPRAWHMGAGVCGVNQLLATHVKGQQNACRGSVLQAYMF